MKSFFCINVNQYVDGKSFNIYRPASLNNPQDNALMFVSEKYLNQADSLLKCKECLVFWPENVAVPEAINALHAVCLCKNPRNGYCGFFRENSITNLPQKEDYEIVNGAYIAKNAIIGTNCRILPGAYIGGEVELGDNCYIGSGVKLMGRIQVGNNVYIRENSVIGADGLSTDRDENGKSLTMPQFGGVIIEDDVQIGALTVVSRGAIDNTIIRRGCRIGNSADISHNVQVGEDTFIVGETIMFGSSSTGKQVYISGNSTIRDGKHVGDNAIVGMGSVVVKDVPNGAVVKGNPAK